MEAVKHDSCKHKRKKHHTSGETSEERGSLYKSDRDIEHKNKRIHTSSGDTEVPLSANQQEDMLETVSGHIRELVMKERQIERTDSSTNTSKDGGTKSKKIGERTKLSKSERKVKESREKETDNGVSSGLSVQESAESQEEALSTESGGVSKDSALEYLHLWKEEREKWSFKKKTQYWLLQHMYDRTKVPKPEFRILLKYLEGLQGHQRELTRQKAQGIVDHFGEEGSSTSKRLYKRAVAIMRVVG